MSVDESKIVLPIVHLNGTSKAELVELRCEVYSALNAAMDALAKMGPNGRDYYPEPGRMQKAEEQHKRRGELLFGLMKEIEAEAGLIDQLG